MPSSTLDISEARRQINSIDERLKDENIIYITRHNKTAFAFVDADYLSAMMKTLGTLTNPEAMELLQNVVKALGRQATTQTK